jgi:hypothetical protein
MGLLWRLQPKVDAHLIHRTIETPAAPTLPAFSHLDGMKPESGAAIDQRTVSRAVTASKSRCSPLGEGVQRGEFIGQDRRDPEGKP